MVVIAAHLCRHSTFAQAPATQATSAPAPVRIHFFVRLIPPRPTFNIDMTAQERDLMGRHVVYWTALFNAGKVLVFGPVTDPKGGYGIAVIEVGSREEARSLIDDDPTVQARLNKMELAPMRVGLHR